MNVQPWLRFWEYTKKSAQDATLEFFRPLIRLAAMQEWSLERRSDGEAVRPKGIAAEVRKTPRLVRDQDRPRGSGAISERLQDELRTRDEGSHSQALSIFEALPSKNRNPDGEDLGDPRWLIEALDEVDRDHSVVPDFAKRAATAVGDPSGEEENVEPARQQEEFVERGNQPVGILHAETETPDERDSSGGQWDEPFSRRKPPMRELDSVVSEAKIQRA
jgi:hypothetical protein